MGISVWQLVIILVIVLLLFGTKRLRNLGGDLGSSIKSFKKSMKDGDESVGSDSDPEKKEQLEKESGDVIEGEVTSKEKDKS